MMHAHAFPGGTSVGVGVGPARAPAARLMYALVVWPPSDRRTWPVTKPASSLHRRAGGAGDCLRCQPPGRPIGVGADYGGLERAFRPRRSARERRAGSIALTRNALGGIKSGRRVAGQPIHAALAIEYPPSGVSHQTYVEAMFQAPRLSIRQRRKAAP